MSRLGLSIVLTAQGIPFLHAGSEFLRTKRTGDPDQDEETIRNSYAADDEVNKLDWQLRADNDDMVEYIKGLIALRKARYEFRLGDADSIGWRMSFTDGLPTTAIAYTLADMTPGDVGRLAGGPQRGRERGGRRSAARRASGPRWWTDDRRD